jgi:spore maturation protein CgeB
MQLTFTSPSALRILHIGGYWRGLNDVVRQMMLGLCSTGATVFEYNTDDHPQALDTEGRPYDRGTFGPVWLREEHLQPVIDEFRPDLIVCNAGGLSFRPAHALQIRKRICLLGIALSDPDVFEPATSKIATNFDVYLTNSEAMIPQYRALGVNVHQWPPATYEGFYRPLPPKPEYRCEVLIFGNGYPDRVPPARALLQRFQTHVYGELWGDYGIASRGLVFGEESLHILSSACITVVFCKTSGGHPIIKPYLFDYPAGGALIATNYLPAVELYFIYGKELIGFETTGELLEKVRFYLDHPEQAEQIRAAGRARVLQEHTWQHVWPRIFRLGEQPAARSTSPVFSGL